MEEKIRLSSGYLLFEIWKSEVKKDRRKQDGREKRGKQERAKAHTRPPLGISVDPLLRSVVLDPLWCGRAAEPERVGRNPSPGSQESKLAIFFK
jgi:hypothetical protein